MRLDKKGFTLIELLAAIVILGLLVTLGYISVRAVLDRSDESYYRSQEDMLILAGREYFTDYRSELPKEIGETNYVALETLMEEKYIDPIRDNDGNNCDNEKSIVTAEKVTETEYQYYGVLICDEYQTSNDEAAPVIKFTPNNETSQDAINVTMEVTDNEKVSKYRYVITKDGEEYQDSGYKDYTSEVTINLTETGLYEITGYARDESNNISSRKSGKYSIYKTIDCSTASFTSNLQANTWQNNNINVNINVPENTYRYEVSVKKDNGDYDVVNSYIGNVASSMEFTTDGTYNVKLDVYDSNGNSCSTTSDDYKIDKTRPTLTYNKVGKSYATKSLQICATGSDNNEIRSMRMEVYNASGTRIYLADKKTNSICYTLSGYNTYTVYTKVTDVASNIQSKNPENVNHFYHQKYTLYNPDPDINFAASCSRICGPNGRDCYVNGGNLGASWRWVFNGAGSGINRNTMRINYSTEWVTDFLVMYYPTTYQSGGLAEWGSNTILFGRLYAQSNIIGTACTNKGKCTICTVYN